MSYSRWGGRGSGHWYTFWCVAPRGVVETRDNALFEICMVAQFTAKQLRDDLDGCMAEVRKLDSVGDIDELKRYAQEFLADVDTEYA